MKLEAAYSWAHYPTLCSPFSSVPWSIPFTIYLYGVSSPDSHRGLHYLEYGIVFYSSLLLTVSIHKKYSMMLFFAVCMFLLLLLFLKTKTDQAFTDLIVLLSKSNHGPRCLLITVIQDFDDDNSNNH